MIPSSKTLNQNISPSVLRRLNNYAIVAQKALKNGEVLTSFEKLAAQCHEYLQTVISDLLEAGVKIDYGNIIQNENLIAAFRQYMPDSGKEEIVMIGSLERISKLLQSPEFTGYSFKVLAIGVVSGKPGEVLLSGISVQSFNQVIEKIKNEGITSAILCTEFPETIQTYKLLREAGIKKIWNFSPLSLEPHPGIVIENVIPGYPKWKASYSLS